MACLNLPQVAGKSENSKPVEFIAELVNDSNVHFLDQVSLVYVILILLFQSNGVKRAQLCYRLQFLTLQHQNTLQLATLPFFQDNEDEPDIELHLTMKFAQGSCITATALDTLMSEAYYNDEVSKC